MSPATTTNFDRAFDLIVSSRIEGGLSMDPHDPGNWTGGQIGVGVLKGTNHGISAAWYPNEDIGSLTLDRVKYLYDRDYWMPHGCEKLEWGKALVVFDTAVNGGPVEHWWKEFGSLPLDSFIDHWQAEHLVYLSALKNWPRECRGWIERVFTVCKEARRVE